MSKLGFMPDGTSVNTGQAVGYNGCDQYNDTDAHTGQWKSFVVLVAATISAITDNGSSPSTVLTGVSLPAGTFVSANGLFTSIQLSAGTVSMTRA